MSTTGTPPNTSTPGQDELEIRYKRSQIRAARAQVGATLIALAAAVAAILVAWQGQETINHNSLTELQQSEESQLSSAITALGSDATAERVAGLMLLTRNTSARFALQPETHDPPADMFGDYTTALQVLSGYLSSHGEAFLQEASGGQATQPFGRGYGLPSSPGVPIDIIYAANQVKILVNKQMERAVIALGMRDRPAIDLGHDDLIGQSWKGINFGWLWAFMPRIDLRGADLDGSRWSNRSTLSDAYLQCSDLQGADFRGADLKGADLRGADVSGANFRGAKIAGAKLAQIFGKAKWPGWLHITTLSARRRNPAKCLKDKNLWDNQPNSIGNPAPTPSSTLKPTPTPRPSAGQRG